MPLENFGSILNFAEELEIQDQLFYATVAANPACAEHKELFEQFAADAKKNITIAQRTRRENVTEMILEPIKDFVRAPFCEECAGADSMSAEDALGRRPSAAGEGRELLHPGCRKNQGIAGGFTCFKNHGQET